MSNPLTYKSAGVDIDAANEAVSRMKRSIRSTFTDAVLSDVGAFGGLFKASFPEMREPVLVSSIDGVGTKTKIAQLAGRYDTIGQDLVNHCVNDILVQGARPLFFLDYYGVGNLDASVASQVVEGVAKACREVGCALIGGETAQMPDVYAGDDFDLVGTIVGIVDREKVLPTGELKPGDAVIGLASSGLHTNGYTLARRVLFDHANLKLNETLSELDVPLADALLAPHRCYAPVVLPLLERFPIRAMAHLTGGGFYDNLPRVLPPDTSVKIDRQSWQIPPLFQLLKTLGNLEDFEMYRTFNMGIGLALFCAREAASDLVNELNARGEQAAIIGEVTEGNRSVQIV